MAFFVFLLLLFLIPAAVAGRFNYTCPAEFECGKLGIAKFPFANFTQPDCGLSLLDCSYQPFPSITLSRSSGQWFVTKKKLLRDQNIISVRDPFLHRLLLAENNKTNKTSRCDHLMYIVFLRNSPSISYTIKYNITIFRCRRYPPQSQEVTDYFKNNHYRTYESCEEFDVLYRNPKYYGYPKENEVPDQTICSSITLPMLPWDDPYVVSKDTELFQMLTAEFDLEWRVSDRCYRNCHLKGGRCETNEMNEFSCVPPAAAMGRVHRKSAKRKIILVTAGASVGITIIALLAILIFVCFRRKKFLISDSVKFWKQSGADKNQELETFLKKYESLTPKRYSYAEVKKMTNSFSIKLGQGGYGTVYKGKLILKNGTPVFVAVKILNESNGNGEEFTNEVDCISRTSHVNIVNLLGFCFEGSKKRALIYEFFVNGSLEKFIYGGGKKLEWPTLYKIAVGIARGLEYLHCGCNTRILHFDIKPHNILLDEEFCPKITDFGLAKLCTRKESMVSTMAARGTVGYIAPEIVCKNIGSVSHKSDVYSYGMMVLEMVGGRKNVDATADRDSEIYFPHWIYSRLMERCQDLGLSGIKSDEENKLARKMLIVSLWCIQTDPFSRPTISNVLEMLEGTTDLDALQMPPKFFFHAPSTASSQGTTT